MKSDLRQRWAKFLAWWGEQTPEQQIIYFLMVAMGFFHLLILCLALIAR